MNPALRVSGLTFAYPGSRHALRGVDLEIAAGGAGRGARAQRRGEDHARVAPQRVLTPSAGTVEVDGLVLGPRTLREVRRRVGLVFQDPDDQLFMPTVGEDVAFGPANFGVRGDELAERVSAALDAVGMAEHAGRAPSHLSEGQRRRVALATVLAYDPRLLVLDEPSANLEPVARRELADVLLGLGRTMLMVTHDLLYALQLCPRSVLVDDGAVVADRPTRELLADTELLARHRLELPWGVRLD